MKSRTTGSILAIALATIGAFALICSRSAAVEAVYPVENARQTFVSKVWKRVSGFFQNGEVYVENARLQRELAALTLLKGDVERLEAENARLRRALGYVDGRPGRWLAAAVLSHGGGAAGARTVLRVDKGSLAGVTKGAVVTVPEGLVGRVASVTPHTAEVLLVTDPSLKVSCEIETALQTKALGVLCGGEEEMLVIKHLKDAEGVAPHSRVITSGLGGVFPRGLEIGTLLCVRKDLSGRAREGEVMPQVGYSMLEDVFIRCEK